jgi:hypothetical protein
MATVPPKFIYSINGQSQVQFIIIFIQKGIFLAEILIFVAQTLLSKE